MVFQGEDLSSLKKYLGWGLSIIVKKRDTLKLGFQFLKSQGKPLGRNFPLWKN